MDVDRSADEGEDLRTADARFSARGLAKAIGCAAARLGFEGGSHSAARTVLGLVREPVEAYNAHPHWPSLLTQFGLPVELSLKVDGSGTPSIRCTVDVTDYRADLAGNRNRYRRYAALVAGAGAARVRGGLSELIERHLDGIPPEYPSRMMHGIGYAAPDRRRGSVYFHTGWLPPGEVSARFPQESAVVRTVERERGCHLGERLQVMGYDLVEGQSPRLKVYRRLAVGPKTDLRPLTGSHADLLPARRLFNAFRASPLPEPGYRTFLHQVSVENGQARQRLFFFCSNWGWTSARGRAELLRFLRVEMSIDLQPLSVMAETLATHGVTLSLSMVALGADHGGTSVTLYLWPASRSAPLSATASARWSSARSHGVAGQLSTRERCSRTSLGGQVRSMVDRAVDRLLSEQHSDGRWSAPLSDASLASLGAPTPIVSDVALTAYIAAVLSGRVARRPALVEAGRWLNERYGRARGWSRSAGGRADMRTTSLALVAAHRAGHPAPPDASALLMANWLDDRRGGGPSRPRVERTLVDVGPASALVLMAIVEVCPRQSEWVLAVAFDLLTRQERDGGWRSGGSTDRTDRLVASWWALESLSRFVSSHGVEELAHDDVAAQTRLAASDAAHRAIGFLSRLPLHRDPAALGSWLGSWSVAGGEPRHPSVPRVLSTLEGLQAHSGLWLGAPNGGFASSAVPDEAMAAPATGTGLMVTAAVVLGLEAFLEATGR